MYTSYNRGGIWRGYVEGWGEGAGTRRQEADGRAPLSPLNLIPRLKKNNNNGDPTVKLDILCFKPPYHKRNTSLEN